MASEDPSVAQTTSDRKDFPNGGASIWDSKLWAPQEAYERFRQVIGGGPSPWTIEQSAPAPFRARFENFSAANGMFGLSKCVSMQSIRSRSDLEKSSDHLLYAVYVLSGWVSVEQDGRTNVAREGDLITIDGALSARTANVVGDGSSCATQITMVMPNSTIHEFTDGQLFRNKLLPKERIPTPLSSLLFYMSLRLVSAAPDELNRLFQAAVHLLPLAVEDLGDGNAKRAFPRSFRALSVFIEDNLANPLLSAEYTAQQLRCSVRYVHKVFSSIGTTFGAYVAERRLDHAHADLTSAGRQTPISTVAYKWGFNDLSTFNRLFKRRFGCTPSTARL